MGSRWNSATSRHVFSPVNRELLSHWVQTQPDRVAGNYLVAVHTDDSGAHSRQLAQQRGAVVLAALQDLGMKGAPELRLVHDPSRRLIVVARKYPGAGTATSLSDRSSALSPSTASDPIPPPPPGDPSSPLAPATPLAPLSASDAPRVLQAALGRSAALAGRV